MNQSIRMSIMLRAAGACIIETSNDSMKEKHLYPKLSSRGHSIR